MVPAKVVGRGRQYHPHIGREALEKELAEERSVCSGGVVSEQLLHPAE